MNGVTTPQTQEVDGDATRWRRGQATAGATCGEVGAELVQDELSGRELAWQGYGACRGWDDQADDRNIHGCGAGCSRAPRQVGQGGYLGRNHEPAGATASDEVSHVQSVHTFSTFLL